MVLSFSQFVALILINLAFSNSLFSFVTFASSKVDAAMRNGEDLVGGINSSSVFLVQAANVSEINVTNMQLDVVHWYRAGFGQGEAL